MWKEKTTSLILDTKTIKRLTCPLCNSTNGATLGWTLHMQVTGSEAGKKSPLGKAQTLMASASKLRIKTERETGGGKTGMPGFQGLGPRTSAALCRCQRRPLRGLFRSVWHFCSVFQSCYFLPSFSWNPPSHTQTKFCLTSVFPNRSVDSHEFDLLEFSQKFTRFYDTSS